MQARLGLQLAQPHAPVRVVYDLALSGHAPLPVRRCSQAAVYARSSCEVQDLVCWKKASSDTHADMGVAVVLALSR